MIAPLIAKGHEYRTHWPTGVVLDDVLWSQSIGVEHYFQEVWNRQALSWTHDEQVLASLMHLGSLDSRPEDRPMDSSVRAMRHSTALADRLWAMVEVERSRVGASVSITLSPINLYPQGDRLERELVQMRVDIDRKSNV